MAISTGTGVTFAIGTTQAASDAQTFESDTYKKVGEVSEIGEFGPSRNIVEFASLDDGRMRKLRGVEDLGDLAVTYADDGTNDGQQAMEAAYAVDSHAADEFNFRIQLNDSVGAGKAPTTIYVRAKVAGLTIQSITSDGVLMRQATLAVNEYLRVPAETA